jgi:hypothetical protein
MNMGQRVINTKFYTFRQNNSGGSFRRDDSVNHYVIIEATSAEHANIIAEEKGIYFNGVEEGYDCSCCGDRWERVEEYDGTDEPAMYGENINVNLPVTEGTKPNVIIYYMDNSKAVGVFEYRY